nr:MAG TPA: hypothetical protein [Caudoviricetes sp.]
MILKKDILNRAYQRHAQMGGKAKSVEAFAKLVVAGLNIIQAEEEENEQGLFISHVYSEEEQEQLSAGIDYKNELEEETNE